MENGIKAELSELAGMVAKVEKHAALAGSGAVADRLLKVKYEIYNISDIV